MNYEQFAELVRAMREAQKAYFKKRYTDDLVNSKKLEERVDKALKDMIDLPMFEE